MSRFSLFAYLLCGALLVATSFFYYPKWKQPGTEATISWDVSGYYLYLPAALIYKDLKQLNWWGGVEEKYHPGPGMGQAFQHDSGNWVMKYTMGQALQFLPWFGVAHLLAEPLGYPADGFSLPYQAAVSWGSLIVALIGLWFLRRVLKMYFSDAIVAAVLICLVFGTNYLEYASITGAMTHNWLFTLYTLLIFSTIRFYQKPAFVWACVIGLLVGWATLTRPTEIVSAIIPVLWGAGSWTALRGRFLFFKQHFSKMTLAAFVAGAVILLQPAYWKYITGEWIVYSYREQGFSWLHPHLTDVLFSARAGWLIYTPMMVFAVLGLFLLRRVNPTPGPSPTGRGDVEDTAEGTATSAVERSAVFSTSPLPVGEGSGVGLLGLLPAILLFCLVSLYITAAWDIWWYGGSLGQRAMVQSYPLWAFPLAAFITRVSERGRRRRLFVPLAAMCIYINLWWSHQAHRGNGLFIAEQMTKAFMLKVLGRYELERDWLKLLDTKEEFKGAERRNVQVVYVNNFDSDTSAVTLEKPISGTRSLMLSKENQFSPVYTVYGSPANPDTMPRWARSTITFQCDPKEWNTWQMTQFFVRFKFSDRIVKQNIIRLQRHVDGSEVKTLFFDTRLPDDSFGTMEVLFWNAGSEKSVRIDDLRVETFD